MNLKDFIKIGYKRQKSAEVSRKPGIVLLFVLYLLSPPALTGQDGAEPAQDSVTENSGAETVQTPGTLSEDELSALADTIAFGTNEEVGAAIDRLMQLEMFFFEPELSEIFNTALDQNLKKKVVDYFFKFDSMALQPQLAQALQDNSDNLSVAVIISYISYISKQSDAQVNDDYLSIIASFLSDDSEQIVIAAVSALAEAGAGDYSEQIVAIYEDGETSQKIRQAIVGQLGKLGGGGFLETLVATVTDQSEEKGMRWAACLALGDFQNDAALATIVSVMNDQDVYLRMNAAAALAKFPPQMVENYLLAAARDTFWRTRKVAIEALAENGSVAAIPLLIYKAERDPENIIKQTALSALAGYSEAEAVEYLNDYYGDETNSFSMRTLVAASFIVDNIDYCLDTVNQVIDKEWSKSDSALLIATAKSLSAATSSRLPAVYQRLLLHPSLAVRLYALEGIKLNRVVELREQVASYADASTTTAVGKLAAEVLASFD